jgi:putative glycerol-1-phosphate prenyltransferase
MSKIYTDTGVGLFFKVVAFVKNTYFCPFNYNTRPMQILPSLSSKAALGKKQFAVLVDPDKHHEQHFESLAILAGEAGVDYLFVGGSLLTHDRLEVCLRTLARYTAVPKIIFPGSTLQINPLADGILFLSLISGRNPEMLIGKHVVAAPYLKNSGLEVLPTGYMLIESGNSTTALYMSNTLPIPSNKSDIASCTAMAGEMLGLKLIYLDAGSGALHPVPTDMIKRVKDSISVPLIVGGGLRTPELAYESLKAGADMVVVGNAIEKDKDLIFRIAEVVKSF